MVYRLAWAVLFQWYIRLAVEVVNIGQPSKQLQVQGGISNDPVHCVIVDDADLLHAWGSGDQLRCALLGALAVDFCHTARARLSAHATIMPDRAAEAVSAIGDLMKITSRCSKLMSPRA